MTAALQISDACTGADLVAAPGPIESHPARPHDPRPYSHGRDPCFLCGQRGDLGCRHQQPDPDR